MIEVAHYFTTTTHDKKINSPGARILRIIFPDYMYHNMTSWCDQQWTIATISQKNTVKLHLYNQIDRASGHATRRSR
jgi:hypothetical protein